MKYDYNQLEKSLAKMLVNDKTILNNKDLVYVIPYLISAAKKVSKKEYSKLVSLSKNKNLKEISQFVYGSLKNKKVADTFSTLAQNVIQSFRKSLEEEFEALDKDFDRLYS